MLFVVGLFDIGFLFVGFGGLLISLLMSGGVLFLVFLIFLLVMDVLMLVILEFLCRLVIVVLVVISFVFSVLIIVVVVFIVIVEWFIFDICYSGLNLNVKLFGSGLLSFE